jgi:ribA/ribD-fused uncharacterized protein
MDDNEPDMIENEMKEEEKQEDIVEKAQVQEGGPEMVVEDKQRSKENEQRLKELKRYYRGKAKNPRLYDYDDDGNLVEKNKEGAVVKTIPLPKYRLPTFEEYDVMEKKRAEDIAKASKEFNDARKRLRELILNPETMPSDIVRQNNAVVLADIQLQKVRHPLKYVSKMKQVEIRSIELSKTSEKRKFPYRIAILQTSPFTLQDQYVREGEPPKKPLISMEEIKQSMQQNIPIILFSEPETNTYGYLSLSWPVDLEYNATVYQSVKQAIYAEIAKAFQDQTNLQKIMLAESPNGIEYRVEDIPGDPELNITRWNELMNRLLFDVNLLKFRQYPALAIRLLETKEAVLGAYLPNDNLLGIGISLDDIQSTIQANWTGQNIVGKVLMDIREQLRNERNALMQQQAMAASVAPKPRSMKIRLKPKSAVSQPSAAVIAEPEAAAPDVEVAPVINLVPPQEVPIVNVPASPVAPVAPGAMAGPRVPIAIRKQSASPSS